MQENQSDTSYRREHQSDRMGVGYDLTSEGIIDDNIYTNPEWYAVMSEKSYQESYAVLNRVRNKPNANVTIYRATPSNEINPGDWVTLSKSYAQEHLERVLNNEGNIVKKVVKAKDIQWAGDDVNEFGYFPDGDIKNSISNTNFQENQSNVVDSIGRKLSKEQQNFFKDSQVRDENGNLKVMYHGTSTRNDFTIFENGKSGVEGMFFFSESPNFSLELASASRGKYDDNWNYFINGVDELYINIK